MTLDEVNILCRDDVRGAIEANLTRDPAAVAADKQLSRTLGAALPLIATQVKYLQRARTKLPHYHASRCIIPPLSYEQAGSAECAAHKRWTGGHCIDLTCGLGVDSANFARHFARVTAVERDPVLSELARINFARLGLANIEVVNIAAEDYTSTPDLTADMVYADPDRRAVGNRKLVLLEDCAPDVVRLHGRLHEIAPRVVIKASPLFDAAEAFRIFGRHTLVEAVSAGDECKELLIVTSDEIGQPTLRASIAGGEGFSLQQGAATAPPAVFAPPYRYLLLPDVSLRKVRLAGAWAASHGLPLSAGDGYAFADRLPAGGMYRHYEIESVQPYNPRALKALLRERGVRAVQIMQRGFPVSNAVIARALGVKEGGTAAIAFCVVGGAQHAVILK